MARTPPHAPLSPRERFFNVAEPRVSKAVSIIRSLRNLNRKEYGPTRQDIEEMISALMQAVGEVREAFERPQGQVQTAFTFKGRAPMPVFEPRASNDTAPGAGRNGGAKGTKRAR